MVLTKKLNILITVALALISIISITVANPSLTSAASAKDAVCKSLGATDEDTTSGDCSGGGTKINDVLKIVLNILSFVAGVIAVIMIIISGIKFITSQGDSGSIASARTTVIYAIVGVVIVLVSQVIVRLVLTEAAQLQEPGSGSSTSAPSGGGSEPTCVEPGQVGGGIPCE